MANEERKKEDIFIKEKRRAKNFFITSSAKMDDDKGVSKTTISSSVFTKMSQSFADGDYLLDDGIREINGSVLYMLQEMQKDIDDVYNEVSASSFQASFFPFARIDSGSFGLISSSLVPGIDNKYDLGASGKEWNDLYIDGTANIDSLAMGTTVTSIKDEDNMSSDSNTALATQQSIKKYVDDNAGGGGTIDSSLTNGSTNAVQNNAVFDGLATKLNLSGGTMTGNIVMSNAVIRPVMVTATSITNFTIDMRAANIFQIKAGSAWVLRVATAAHVGQEITIIGLSAGTIVNGKGKEGTFLFANGSNLSVSAGQAYKFISDSNGVWRQIH